MVLVKMAACRKVEMHPYLSPQINFHPKWVRDLKIRPDTLNLAEEKMGDIGGRTNTDGHLKQPYEN